MGARNDHHFLFISGAKLMIYWTHCTTASASLQRISFVLSGSFRSCFLDGLFFLWLCVGNGVMFLAAPLSPDTATSVNSPKEEILCRTHHSVLLSIGSQQYPAASDSIYSLIDLLKTPELGLSTVMIIQFFRVSNSNSCNRFNRIEVVNQLKQL